MILIHLNYNFKWWAQMKNKNITFPSSIKVIQSCVRNIPWDVRSSESAACCFAEVRFRAKSVIHGFSINLWLSNFCIIDHNPLPWILICLKGWSSLSKFWRCKVVSVKLLRLKFHIERIGDSLAHRGHRVGEIERFWDTLLQKCDYFGANYFAKIVIFFFGTATLTR